MIGVVRSSESHRVLMPTVCVSMDEQLMLSEGMSGKGRLRGKVLKSGWSRLAQLHSQPSSKDRLPGTDLRTEEQTSKQYALKKQSGCLNIAW